MSLQFEWDDVKAETKMEKHNVSFEEAQTVFKDQLAFIFDDEAHSVRGTEFVDIPLFRFDYDVWDKDSSFVIGMSVFSKSLKSR